MSKSEHDDIPRYLKIAVDLSEKIASETIPEGCILKGRSVLSTQYGVSPETIRRAISLLSDKGVVEIKNGIGVLVVSRNNANIFKKHFDGDEIISNMRKRLLKAYNKRNEIDREIINLNRQIVDMYQYQRFDLIIPVAIKLPVGSCVIGKSIRDLEIWHKTGATIVGVIHEGNTIVSPGPYYEFAEEDTVIIAGDKNVIERFNAYINGIMA